MGGSWPARSLLIPEAGKSALWTPLLPMKKYAIPTGELPEENQTLNSRKCYVGAERVRDIVNDYDPVTYRLPYEYENRWFHLCYCPP